MDIEEQGLPRETGKEVITLLESGDPKGKENQNPTMICSLKAMLDEKTHNFLSYRFPNRYFPTVATLLQFPITLTLVFSLLMLINSVTGQEETEKVNLDQPLTHAQERAEAKFTFQAFDCDSPTSISAMHLPMDCMSLPGESEEKALRPVSEWFVLQEVVYKEYQASFCRQTRSQLSYSCSVWGHSSLHSVPHTTREQKTSILDCEAAVRTSQFRLPNGQKIDIQKDEYPNYLEYTQGRAWVEGGYARCEGVPGTLGTGKQGGKFIRRMVNLVEIHFTVGSITVRENILSGDLHFVQHELEVDASKVI